MCELLGLNCATPTDVRFSFTGFAARGGITDHHADGWGIAFFEEKACRLFIDHQSSCESPVAELVKRYPIKSKNTIAHIRKATQGAPLLENCHPFMRELWGRHWIFAHNGDLKNYAPVLSGLYQPVGTTDSELAFCEILDSLRRRFPGDQPPLDDLFDAVADITASISRHGTFNFLISNGQAMFAHCATHLHYLTRQWPFSTAHLVDEDMSIDFAQYTTPEDRVTVIGTLPLTDNEVWTPFAPGDLMLFKDGECIASRQLPIPEAVMEVAIKPRQRFPSETAAGRVALTFPVPGSPAAGAIAGQAASMAQAALAACTRRIAATPTMEAIALMNDSQKNDIAL